MKKDKNHYNNKKIHLIGAGGISMNGIAKHLIERGALVSASDIIDSQELRELESLGAKIKVGHSKTNVDNPDLVVYSKAVDFCNPELNQALEKGIKIYSRSQTLGKILSNFEKSVGISGSHGKTTLTAMIARSLVNANKNPTVFLGGQDKIFGNYISGDHKIAVTEACEYKKSFLDLKCDITVVLNVDNDHMDSYIDKSDMLNAFKEFTKGSITVLNADDTDATKLFNSTTLTFGIEQKAHYQARHIKEQGAKYSFTAYAYGQRLGRINLSILGKHNIYNALACVAVCDLLKVPFLCVKRALENFDGVYRRNEYIGEYLGKKCYCDYAHHPKEIVATISAFKEKGEKFITVFQPHTYSRTKLLMNDFILAFKDVSPLLIMDTYPAREKFCEQGSAKRLKENLIANGNKSVKYIEKDGELGTNIQNVLDSEINSILFLGAGDIYQKAKNILVQKNAKKV